MNRREAVRNLSLILGGVLSSELTAALQGQVLNTGAPLLVNASQEALLAEAADKGIGRALALVAVMTRWTTLALVDQHGRDGALRCVESTRLDAAVAEPDEE